MNILRKTILLALCGLTLAVGAALAAPCDGNYCTSDVEFCFALDIQQQDNCCLDLDENGVRNCSTCTRDLFECWVDGQAEYRLSGPYNCSSPGDVCQ